MAPLRPLLNNTEDLFQCHYPCRLNPVLSLYPEDPHRGHHHINQDPNQGRHQKDPITGHHYQNPSLLTSLRHQSPGHNTNQNPRNPLTNPSPSLHHQSPSTNPSLLHNINLRSQSTNLHPHLLPNSKHLINLLLTLHTVLNLQLLSKLMRNGLN